MKHIIATNYAIYIFLFYFNISTNLAQVSHPTISELQNIPPTIQQITTQENIRVIISEYQIGDHIDFRLFVQFPEYIQMGEKRYTKTYCIEEANDIYILNIKLKRELPSNSKYFKQYLYIEGTSQRIKEPTFRSWKFLLEENGYKML